jgi:hypothetical protein
MKNIFFILTFLISISIFAKNTESITVKGEAAIINNDKLSAKDRALDDAKRKAVEQVTGVVVSSESLSQNFELISDKIYSKAKGYISSYSVVKEGVDPKDTGVYFVEIKAVVSKDKLEKDINAVTLLYKSLGKPKFLLMIAEQNFGEKTPSGWWSNIKSTTNSVETVIINELGKKGFKFVDGKTLQNKLKKYSQFKNIDGVTAKDIVAINTLHDADYVVYGSVIVSVKNGLAKTKSGFAMGTLKIVKSSNGEVVGTIELKDRNNKDGNPDNFRGEAVNRPDEIIASEDAFSAFGKRASKQILKKVLNHWLNQVNSTREISIKIKGLKYKKYKELKAQLLDIRGVKSVENFKMVHKIAAMTVNYKGKVNQLLDMITDKPLKGLKLELETVNNNEIIFSVEK